MSKKNQKKEYKTLLSVLANGSTDSARMLLKKHSGQDASDTKDLELKLARVYANSPRKLDIEKEFAEIHPHKDFILKYIKPIPVEVPKEEPKIEEAKVVSQTMLHEGYASANGNENPQGRGMAWGRPMHPPCGNPNCQYCSRYFDGSNFSNFNNFSNCQGNPNCNCGMSNANGMSNACGCSSADGQPSGMSGNSSMSNQSLMVVGLVSVVAIFGMVMYLKSNK